MALNKEFHSDLFPLIWNQIIFQYLTRNEDGTGVGSVRTKKGVSKRRKQVLREAGFSNEY